jgi:hypothetical protein
MLIIETGSVVLGADSYASAAELVAYGLAYGRTVPAAEADQESALRRAYLQMDALPWKGDAVSRDQTGAWPRYNVCRNNFTIDSTTIPAQIKAGQMALATEIYADDIDPPEQKTGAVTRERVEGAVDVQYAAVSSSAAKPAATRQSYAQFAGFLESSNQVRLVRG